MISLERLEFLLHVFPKLTVGLVGDLFLDRYLEIDAGVGRGLDRNGLGGPPGDPHPQSAGALGTVMNNLAALGAGCLKPVTVIGDDGLGVRSAAGDRNAAGRPVVRAPLASRLTPTYVKPLRPTPDGSWQELNRLDVRSRSP